eukprot:3064833-Prymnesium_polylepis.2
MAGAVRMEVHANIVRKCCNVCEKMISGGQDLQSGAAALAASVSSEQRCWAGQTVPKVLHDGSCGTHCGCLPVAVLIHHAVWQQQDRLSVGGCAERVGASVLHLW